MFWVRSRRSCSRGRAAPSSPGEIVGWFVALALSFGLLCALANSHTATHAPPTGWYVGYDGNYYPNGFPEAGTLPKPQGPVAAPVTAASPPAVEAGPTNWPLLVGISGGAVLILAALFWPYGRRNRRPRLINLGGNVGSIFGTVILITALGVASAVVLGGAPWRVGLPVAVIMLVVAGALLALANWCAHRREPVPVAPIRMPPPPPPDRPQAYYSDRR
jgi:hypothetical protein